MDNDEKKKKKTDGGKEHKPNWKEYVATVDDIKAYLDNHIYLRRNVVMGRVEYRWPMPPKLGGDRGLNEGMFCACSDPQPPNLGGQWHPITDVVENTLWEEMSRTKQVNYDHLHRIINSNSVTAFHPFRYYLEHLPPWDGETDYIMGLSLTVNVRGGAEEQMRFYQYLKKWMVAMVAGWLEPEVVNNVILVLVGEQGIYKTTWFNYLLPPCLRSYFYTKTNSSRMSKDDLLVLTQYGLICCEELDTMSPREMNNLKSAVTMPSVDERPAYARYHEHRCHVASFCGTGNNPQFLSDPTGTRRWLPFEVESIESPRDHPLDYDAIYAEAYTLYQQGFQYWFSQQEVAQLNTRNEAFEAPKDEEDLVDYYFRLPSGGDTGEFMPTVIAQQVVSTTATRVTTVGLGRAFRRLGFRQATVGNRRGFYVVRRTEEERRTRARSIAVEAGRDSQQVLQITDDTDIF